MPQMLLETDAAERYKVAMEARVAVLERIAEQNHAAFRDLRTDMRDFRAEMREMRQEMQAGFNEARRIHERDFRITFGAFILTAIGLAGLIARSAHWM
jgi:hypothetical protein